MHSETGNLALLAEDCHDCRIHGYSGDARGDDAQHARQSELLQALRELPYDQLLHRPGFLLVSLTPLTKTRTLCC